ncbi:hypothetical protein ANN_01594 [Periplaneta americana]|uniref:Uncharacterized protein n=1 Tax=Periplaneta americana TaxID=6978 RepID=A0ABQ8TVT0_PERAM|nr:hypothetical protein ANN_01594 [Periplaneta americana]
MYVRIHNSYASSALFLYKVKIGTQSYHFDLRLDLKKDSNQITYILSYGDGIEFYGVGHYDPALRPFTIYCANLQPWRIPKPTPADYTKIFLQIESFSCKAMISLLSSNIYILKFEVMREDAFSIATAHEYFAKNGIQEKIQYIHNRFFKIPEILKQLEAQNNSLEHSLCPIDEISLSGEKTNIEKEFTEEELWNFSHAPVTSCDVERTLSLYKSFFTDKRRSFTQENLRMTFLVYCNSLQYGQPDEMATIQLAGLSRVEMYYANGNDMAMILSVFTFYPTDYNNVSERKFFVVLTVFVSISIL